jgi:anti-sigma B factor antagonist
LEAGVLVIRPSGELDLATAPVLDRWLVRVRQGGGRCVALDLRGLTFIDSSGVHLVHRWWRTTAADGIELRLIAGAPHVQQVFQFAGVDAVLPFAVDGQVPVDPPVETASGRRRACRSV